MPYLISAPNSAVPRLETFSGTQAPTPEETILIDSNAALLECYLDTAEDAPLMPLLRQIRDEIIEDLDQIESVAEIYGLMYWLLADHNIDNRGESLEQTADRLGDLDIEQDSDQYGDLIFHLKDAVERLYDLEFD